MSNSSFIADLSTFCSIFLCTLLRLIRGEMHLSSEGCRHYCLHGSSTRIATAARVPAHILVFEQETSL